MDVHGVPFRDLPRDAGPARMAARGAPRAWGRSRTGRSAGGQGVQVVCHLVFCICICICICQSLKQIGPWKCVAIIEIFFFDRTCSLTSYLHQCKCADCVYPVNV